MGVEKGPCVDVRMNGDFWTEGSALMWNLGFVIHRRGRWKRYERKIGSGGWKGRRKDWGWGKE